MGNAGAADKARNNASRGLLLFNFCVRKLDSVLPLQFWICSNEQLGTISTCREMPVSPVGFGLWDRNRC